MPKRQGVFFWKVFPQSNWVSAQRFAKFLASDQTNRWCKSQRARCEWLMRNLFRCKLAAKSVPPKNCHHHQQQQHRPWPIARHCWMLGLRAICWKFFGLVSFVLLHFEFMAVVLLAPAAVRVIPQLALAVKDTWYLSFLVHHRTI